MNPTVKKTNTKETRGIKAFKLVDGQLMTGGIGGSIQTVFEPGKTYTLAGEPDLCANGYHFYAWGNGCFGVELFGKDTVCHEIIAYGEVISDTEKCVCLKIKIGDRACLKLDGNRNSGNWNSGYSNSGNRNSGNSNSGNWNSGNSNSGNRNSGHSNSGHSNSGYSNSGYSNSGNSNSGDSNSGYSNSGDSNSGYSNSGNRNSGNSNSGNWNSGNRNSGDSNSGDRNSGYRNSGDSNSGHSNSGYSNSGDSNSGNWNSANFESGCFNSKTSPTIRVFNKKISRKKWDKAIKPSFLFFEQLENETYKEAFQRSWNDTTNEDRELVEKLPNFNWDVFTEISGIENPKGE